LGDYSVPQPDLILLKPRADFYSGQIPTAPDVLLLVEISASSLAFDQGIKRALYFRHGVAEYWVIDIPGKRIHVYREPTDEGYAQALECGPNRPRFAAGSAVRASDRGNAVHIKWVSHAQAL
jgi:Uma2 family endonuclease